MRGWEPILPGVRWFYVRSPADQRSASGAGGSTPCGAVSTRGFTVFVPRFSELKRFERISDQGMGTYPPRGALALMYDPQSISDWPVGLVFPHRAGRFRLGGSPFSSPGCRSCKGLEGILIGGCEPILLGCAGSTYDPQPIRDRPAGLGVPHRVGRF